MLDSTIFHESEEDIPCRAVKTINETIYLMRINIPYLIAMGAELNRSTSKGHNFAKRETARGGQIIDTADIFFERIMQKESDLFVMNAVKA